MKRAERGHGKTNLMLLKVKKCVKMLLLPTERAVNLWEKSNSLPTTEAMRKNKKPMRKS